MIEASWCIVNIGIKIQDDIRPADLSNEKPTVTGRVNEEMKIIVLEFSSSGSTCLS